MSDQDEEKSFVARVQIGYRVQIPEPVRSILDIKEGDIVEVRIRKAKPPAGESGALEE